MTTSTISDKNTFEELLSFTLRLYQNTKTNDYFDEAFVKLENLDIQEEHKLFTEEVQSILSKRELLWTALSDKCNLLQSSDLLEENESWNVIVRENICFAHEHKTNSINSLDKETRKIIWQAYDEMNNLLNLFKKLQLEANDLLDSIFARSVEQ